MIKIYHNPRCSKSREGLAILENSGKKFEVIKYLENVPTIEELTEVLQRLGIKPQQLLRKTEAIWKEKYKGQELSDAEIIAIMVANPKLIERPIVVNGKKAVLGRPPQNILNII
ncbi:arsenate reductase (glutaredoxin) [Aurantibacter crassamenti]|uniref:arsenate reductase (glutaredoxin) n=1 Tax=Aurantibacter crassamenti TaxID=1837375 RepID=UPI00193A6856|nr:arsenate reductase (glutaredoxin) [Aurantibacter crassamenti]MBM1107401.1 arsenate reductase (glutaredoxin) [Aurantibacter crassamenti]